MSYRKGYKIILEKVLEMDKTEYLKEYREKNQELRLKKRFFDESRI